MYECNETITVFNAKLDKSTGYDVYTGTVIVGASWFSTIAASVDGDGLKADDVFTVRIPEDASFSGKSYIVPEDYAASDASKYFTLRAGDIVIKGAVSMIDPKPSEILSASSEAFKILKVTDNRWRPNARHWKVIGS